MKLLSIRSRGVAVASLVAAGSTAGPLSAQGTVSGQITDKTNQQPIAGASVLVVGTSLQARTGREGRYSITNVAPGQYRVQVRFIGYATATQAVTVTAGQPATLDVVLTAAAVPLDVVVVSATGEEQQKRELGNNVGTIAANGVIQIRTKQGRPGPTKWTAYAEGGSRNDMGDWPANYFSRQASGASCRLSSQARGVCAIVAVDSFNPLVQNSPFRTGVRQEYGVSAEGGNEATTFYVSGGFQRERGVFESNDLRQTNLRANLRNQVSRLMDISATIGYVSSVLALPQNDNNDQ